MMRCQTSVTSDLVLHWVLDAFIFINYSDYISRLIFFFFFFFFCHRLVRYRHASILTERVIPLYCATKFTHTVTTKPSTLSLPNFRRHLSSAFFFFFFIFFILTNYRLERRLYVERLNVKQRRS